MADSEIYLIEQQPKAEARVFVVTEAQLKSGYQFDVVTKYATRYTFRPTNHGLPSGASISDHVVKNPVQFTLSGVLTPYHVVSPIRLALTSEFASSVREEITAATATAIETVNRRRDRLLEMANALTPLTIIGNSFQHANMVITSITDPKTPDIGDGFQFTIGFQQIRIAPVSSQLPPLLDEDAQKAGTLSAVFLDR